ncbi:hypothetical protein Tco_1215752 [Tanacetum coccineum]
MDDPNITMEEYIRLEEEKAQKRGKVFNWETAKYGKIWYDEDVHDLISVETEFLAIVFNDNLSSNETLSCEPTHDKLVLTDPEDQAKMEMETPRSSGVNSPSNAHNTTSATLRSGIMIKKSVSMRVRRSQHHMKATLHKQG